MKEGRRSLCRTFRSDIVAQFLGKPVPDSNVVLEPKRSVRQQAHW